MKTLLAILLSFIVSEAPVLAIHGGYSLTSSGSVVGEYAGALVPIQDTLLATGSNEADFGANSLGLFTITIPQTGLGTGTVYLFSNGQQMTGPIQAIPDPTNTSGIIGVISATGQISASANQNDFGFIFNTTFVQVTGQAGGGFEAIATESNVSDSPTGVNLSGTAHLTVQTTSSNGLLTPTDAITFELFGFQQD